MDPHSQTLRINSRFGLHMRPAAEVSKLAAGFDALVALNKGRRIAHAHSVVELLTLGACHGDEIKVTAVGNEAETALDAVIGYLENYSDEQSPTDINEAA
jgi:phosphotransferase system HPr (HPr) family protein